MRIAVVLGTRPEAVKLAPLVHEIRARGGNELRLWLTGQHREMVAQVTEFFDLRPDADLGIMVPNQTLADIAARTMSGLVPMLAEFRPNWLVVQGDTTTAFAAGLAAFYQGVKVAHVEAGLRSGDLRSPFPEEANRVLIGRLADLHLAPTPAAAARLAEEGVPAKAIATVGNTVVDALHLGLARLEAHGLPAALAAALPPIDPSRRLLLVTGHRRESFGEPFKELCRALRELAETEPVQIVYPVHLNPNVRGPVFEILGGVPNVHLVQPVPYPALLWLMKRSHFILTDSGGIQEEAPSLGKAVIVLRDVTERQESVDAGVSVLVGTDRARILAEARKLLHDPAHYERMSRRLDLYGDGRASERIADLLGLAPPARREAVPAWPAPEGAPSPRPAPRAAEDRVAELERLVEERERELRMVTNSLGWRALERYRRVRDVVVPRAARGKGRALLKKAKHAVETRFVATTYSPYDRLTYLKPIPVEVLDGAWEERARSGPRVPFTLVATCFNEVRAVDEWVASLAAQSLLPDEVVVVDGGSTDGTADRLEACAAAVAGLRLTVIRSERRVNIAAGRNVAIRAASHDVIVCTDFGCRLDADYLRLISAAFRDPAVDLAAGAYRHLGATVPGVTEWFVPDPRWIDPATYLPSARSVAFRRAVWERCGGFPEWLTLTGEDTLFDLHARRFSRKWAYVPGARVSWRAPASLSEGLAVARRYGAGDGEAGLEGLYDTYRKARAYRRASRVWAWPAAAALGGWRALRGQGRRGLVAVSRLRGYEEGRRGRVARLASTGRIRGSALVLSGVPIYDCGGGQRGAQLALELIGQGFETTYVNVYPSFEERSPIYLDTSFELLSLAAMDDFDVERWIRDHRAVLSSAVAILEFPHPRFVSVARRLRRAGVKVVYDCIDEWKSTLGWQWYSENTEREVAALADVVTASARTLEARTAEMTSKPVHYLPQAVNASAFQRDGALAAPTDLPPGSGPIVLYVGSLWGSWFDWDLVRAAADAMPEARFVFIGEYRGQCPFQRDNVHFLGLKPHGTLAGYLAAASVCTIPFKVDEITRAVNPLKVYEYLAMGRPVVASALPELSGMPYVLTSDGPEAYVENLRRALSVRVDPGQVDAFVAENTWSRRVEDLLRWCGLGATAPASARAPVQRAGGTRR